MNKKTITDEDFNFQRETFMANMHLPDGFEHMKTERPYLRPSKMEQGDTKIRFVCRPIAGWEDWQDNKPLRFRPDQKPKAPIDPLKPIKAFWAIHVWDYAKESLFVMEITQATILKSLAAFAGDPDFGDLTGYDLKFRKEGDGKNAKYAVTPLPPKPLGESIKRAVAASPVRLEALYDGGDPWNDLTSNLSLKKQPTLSDPNLYDRVNKMLAAEPEKEKLMKVFCEQFKVSGILDATDEQLIKLEERLNHLKSKREPVKA